jgi:hypothetical protein
MSQRCSAKNRKGKRCDAWAITGGIQCALHSNPKRASEIGSKHGRGVRFLSARDGLPHRPLKSLGEVSELLEETINRVREGPFDLRAANAIGFLSGILLKALDQRLEERLAHLESVVSVKRGMDTEVFEFRQMKEGAINEKPSQASEGD